MTGRDYHEKLAVVEVGFYCRKDIKDSKPDLLPAVET